MAEKKESKPKFEKTEAKDVKQAKPKLIKKKYPLIKDVSINGTVKKKGTLIELTSEGKQYFKNNFYI